MATDNSGELSAFHKFVGSQLESGSNLSPQEAVDQWRAMHPSEDEMDDIEALVQEAIDDIATGDKGIPFDEVLAEIETRFGLKPTPKPT